MQTFLPYKDYVKSLMVLDTRRLGKQRLEAYQLLTSTRGWINHPARIMWRNYKPALTHYYNLSLQEWTRRNYFNVKLKPLPITEPIILPDWPDEFYTSHQSNLLRKDYTHYHQYFPNVPDNLPYIWPRS